MVSHMKTFTKFTMIFLFLLSVFQTSKAISGKLEFISILNVKTGDTISFHIYLPENYSKDTIHYPVVYQLHGINGWSGGKQTNIVPPAFEKAYLNGTAPKVIIVFPDGLKNSMYANSYDSVKMVEQNIIEEIIPYIDSNFRTLNTREHRYIQGFSMGGFGAVKFAAKYPQLFQASISFDGAFNDWRIMLNKQPDVSQEIFNNSEDYFNEYSPLFWLKKNQEIILKNGVGFYIIKGGLLNQWENINEEFKQSKIPFESYITECKHNFACLMDEAGQDAIKFMFLYSNQKVIDEPSMMKKDEKKLK